MKFTPRHFGPGEPPYVPKYVKHSIISAGRPERYRVVSVEEASGHYVLRPLFSGSVRADLVLWAWKDCDDHSELEWVDDKPVYALKTGTERLRPLTAMQAKSLGVKTHDE